MLDKILHYTNMFLLKNPFFMFLANFIFVVSQLKIHPAVHLSTSKVLTILVFQLVFCRAPLSTNRADRKSNIIKLVTIIIMLL